jgi:hypothetical protein
LFCIMITWRALQARQRRQYLLHLITPHRHQHQLERAVPAGLEQAGRVDLADHAAPVNEDLHVWSRSPVM